MNRTNGLPSMLAYDVAIASMKNQRGQASWIRFPDRKTGSRESAGLNRLGKLGVKESCQEDLANHFDLELLRCRSYPARENRTKKDAIRAKQRGQEFVWRNLRLQAIMRSPVLELLAISF